jgi:hypothetical protein
MSGLILALMLASQAAPVVTTVPKTAPTATPPVEIVKPLKAEERAEPAEGQAVVTATIRAAAKGHGSNTLIFARIDDKGAWSTTPMGKKKRDRLPAFALGNMSFAMASRETKDNVDKPRRSTYVVPAGRYVLVAYEAAALRVTSFCLRSAAFEVKAGEAVDLGDFVSEIPAAQEPMKDPAVFKMQPLGRLAHSGDLEIARAALPAGDPLKASLKPAEFVNGVNFACTTTPPGVNQVNGVDAPAIYGYDMPGATTAIPPAEASPVAAEVVATPTAPPAPTGAGG